MEGKKQTGSSSSSFTSDLFGSKEYSSSSTGIFGSIFAPASPKVLGRESLRFEVDEKKQDSADDAWNTKSGTPTSDLTSKMNEVHQSIMGVKISIIILRLPIPQARTRCSKRMDLKMTQAVLQEEIGGRGASITKFSRAMAYIYLGIKASYRVVV
uniref:Uncharacterized protein n=1 Tax=Populus alba TaxID=43335 RepID=A0A4V6ABQ1_POPAL|nr:hypothetical protein D5086_0000057490 [Populus alba]